MNKTEWKALMYPAKRSEIENRVQELIDIEKRKHSLYNAPNDEGRIPALRRRLEQELFDFLDWEEDPEVTTED